MKNETLHIYYKLYGTVDSMKMNVENSPMSSFQLDCNDYNQSTFIILTLQCLLL